MIVIGHQHLSVNAQLVPLAQLRQQLQKVRPVAIATEDVLAGVAAVGDVVPQARLINSQRSAHRAERSPCRPARASLMFNVKM
jgi:hypothetical protein